MLLIIKMLMLLVAGVLIGVPLFKTLEGTKPAADGVSQTRKETVFTALGEIEFEYHMKKLENDDYEELKSKYQLQALDLLEEEDQEIDREMGQQLKKLGKKKKD